MVSRFNKDWKAVYFPKDDIWDVDASLAPYDPTSDPSERYSVLETLSESDARLIAAVHKLVAYVQTRAIAGDSHALEILLELDNV